MAPLVSSALGLMGAEPKDRPAADITDIAVWREIRDSQDPEDFRIFLESFPESVFAPYARNREARLRTPPVQAEPAGRADAVPEAPDPGGRTQEAALRAGVGDDAAARLAELDAFVEANKQEVGRELARFWRKNHREQYQRGQILGWETLKLEGSDYLVRVEFFLQHRYPSPRSEWETRVFRVRLSGDDLEFLAYATDPG